jgi:hypothetical protein
MNFRPVWGALLLVGCGGEEFLAAPDDSQGVGELAGDAFAPDAGAGDAPMGPEADSSSTERAKSDAVESAADTWVDASGQTPESSTDAPAETSAPVCSAATCGGCCADPSTCSTGNTAGACGRGGAACHACVGQCIYDYLNGILCCRGDGSCGCLIGDICH